MTWPTTSFRSVGTLSASWPRAKPRSERIVFVIRPASFEAFLTASRISRGASYFVASCR
ncbi:MAG: hypothetical protein ACYS99_04180 [Planctomycetota bacterium]|jgi:hypothetical protein